MTNNSLTAAMIKINQQINQTKEIVLRDSFKQNVFHENLHNIISECIYENMNKKTKICIQTTTEKTINRLTRELNNKLNTRINDLENTQATPNTQQQYEQIIDEQDNETT